VTLTKSLPYTVSKSYKWNFPKAHITRDILAPFHKHTIDKNPLFTLNVQLPATPMSPFWISDMSNTCHSLQKLRHRTILLDLLSKSPFRSESFVRGHAEKVKPSFLNAKLRLTMAWSICWGLFFESGHLHNYEKDGGHNAHV
jgi:hypothetical protein